MMKKFSSLFALFSFTSLAVAGASFSVSTVSFAEDSGAAKSQGEAKATQEERGSNLADRGAKEKKIPKKAVAKTAVIKTSAGDITVKLFADKAPKTIENFVGLATGKKEWKDARTGGAVKNKPLYNGTIFHRIIPDFMIQGGDPLGDGTGGPGYQFEDETSGSDAFDKPYILAMANAGKNTNGSQFFITVKATPWLNGKHTIFGEVTKGQDVVDKIVAAPKGANDRPETPVKINKIVIKY